MAGNAPMPQPIRMTIPSQPPSVGKKNHSPEPKTGTIGWAALYTVACFFSIWLYAGPVGLYLPLGILTLCSFGGIALYAVYSLFPASLSSANPVNQWVPSQRKYLDNNTLAMLSIGIFIIATGSGVFLLGLILWVLVVTTVDAVIGDGGAWPFVHVVIGYGGGGAAWVLFLIVTFWVYW